MNLTSVSVAELREFADLVLRMRAAQRAFFLEKDRTLLDKCKRLELLVDGIINDWLKSQPKLFDPEGEEP